MAEGWARWASWPQEQPVVTCKTDRRCESRFDCQARGGKTHTVVAVRRRAYPLLRPWSLTRDGLTRLAHAALLVELPAHEGRVPALALRHVHALHDTSVTLCMLYRFSQTHRVNDRERDSVFVEALVSGHHGFRVSWSGRGAAVRRGRVDG